MSRVIKFRAWDKLRKEWYKASENGGFSPYIGFHVFGECTLLDSPRITDLQHIELQQFTGLTDIGGVDIYDGDLLNVFYTSGDGRHIHDCVYTAKFGCIGIEFVFESLLWTCHGWNQYPISKTLCERYDTLQLMKDGLVVPDKVFASSTYGYSRKENDRSNYFKVIGNIYEHPHLLEAGS